MALTGSPDPCVTLALTGEGETARLATRLAPFLRSGDAILLDGALAAGKTFFTRALVAALGSSDAVSSPTYAIANIYGAPDFEVLHVDAYRLSGAQAFYDLGLDDYLDTALCVVEWGARVEAMFDNPLRLAFAFADGDDTARHVVLSARGARWAPVLQALAQEARP